MEEEKAAAYYEELTRKGEGAARFKQGLGFSNSSSNDVVPKPGSALASSSSSFLSQFVKASNLSNPSESDKQAQIQSIQSKLKKKPSSESRVSERTRECDRNRRRSRSRERFRERSNESRKRSRSRDGERYRHRDRRRRRSRSRSESDSDRERRRRERDRGRRRSRSFSPRRLEKNRSDRGKVSEGGKRKNAVVDYAKLIDGYEKMSSSERVKAKMKLQLSETAAQDSEKGVGWERFEFNKDAPLDDEEVEVAEDDASLVKHIGQSFRFSAVKAKREEQIQAAHDEAIFGASTLPPSIGIDSEPEIENEKEVDKKDLVTSLLSETVLAKRKGSWRDRVREV
ncbi:PREDICTED: probable ATP-dependent RNA helicase DDX46 [Lupinus angustifolius]|uniref:probable ATP-dependent RNA helicase DDX46 n=1 Tax=Lupinus angustifolius TaxID=3871 RepID=UPI00092F3F5D|nr:PREDICTED: probable ATP-dependent RNA helicase DDX46 [Lupinus angustifolius]